MYRAQRRDGLDLWNRLRPSAKDADVNRLRAKRPQAGSSLSQAALAAVEVLRAAAGKTAEPADGEAVIDVARYAASARGRNILTS